MTKHIKTMSKPTYQLSCEYPMRTRQPIAQQTNYKRNDCMHNLVARFMLLLWDQAMITTTMCKTWCTPIHLWPLRTITKNCYVYHFDGGQSTWRGGLYPMG